MNHDPDFGPIYGERKTLTDGRIAYVMPLVFGRARINVGDMHFVEDGY